jgi:hypothetical protein
MPQGINRWLLYKLSRVEAWREPVNQCIFYTYEPLRGFIEWAFGVLFFGLAPKAFFILFKNPVKGKIYFLIVY